MVEGPGGGEELDGVAVANIRILVATFKFFGGLLAQLLMRCNTWTIRRQSSARVAFDAVQLSFY